MGDMKLLRRLGVVLILCLGLLAPSETLGQASPPTKRGKDARPVQQKLAAKLAGLPEGEFRAACKRDNCLHLDRRGKPLYICDHGPAAAPDVGEDTEPYVGVAPYPLDQTFKLHTRPGARRVIYLDFDGHVTRNTSWNSAFTGGADIATPAFDTDGNAAAFSDAERRAIQDIWLRVAEDFAPFDVDVTTEDPGVDALIRSGSSDTTWGVRVCIGGSSSDWLGQGAGGIAYINSFGINSDTPCFVFPRSLGNNAKYIAEATSHEIGHTLGLYHSSQSNGTEYYQGHADWAPIMGVGYYKAVTQWTRGDYPLSSNSQDNLAVIAGKIPLYDPIQLTAVPTFSGTTADAGGILTRRSQVDAYLFEAGAGPVSFTGQVATPSPNAKLSLSLRDANGNLVATGVPSGMGASLSADVAAGTYTVTVDGVGTGDALTAYTDYGSLGRYRLTGSWAAPAPVEVNQLPVASTSGTTPTSGTAPLTVQFSSAASADPDGTLTSTQWNFGNGAVSTEPNPSFTYTTPGNYTATLTVTDNAGAAASATVLISVLAPPSPGKICRVGDLSLTWAKSGKGLAGRATVVVTDAAGSRLSNATVTGSFSGLVNGRVSGRTGRKGDVRFSTPSLPANTRGSLTFTVESITLGGYTYDATRNSADSATISR
jgi:PKD repeat protein